MRRGRNRNHSICGCVKFFPVSSFYKARFKMKFVLPRHLSQTTPHQRRIRFHFRENGPTGRLERLYLIWINRNPLSTLCFAQLLYKLHTKVTHASTLFTQIYHRNISRSVLHRLHFCLSSGRTTDQTCWRSVCT